MSCNKPSRPTQVVCADCPTVVPVKRHGKVPKRCPPCEKAYWREDDRQKREWKKLHGDVPMRQKHTGPFALGPERPELGMTESELLAWRERRAVELYNDEPDLTMEVIAERLGVTAAAVSAYLTKANVPRRPYERSRLAAGLPVWS